ncbi:MAG: xanthine dehydrogenase family protein molybdopterin-binding subunit [Acidobacteria bacterium]|nr:xanthine dehydrogenase family protein molybdopterin-binding subunit [Acidobacteriota bacterium]
MSAPVTRVRRRAFLQQIFSAGAFVLSARLPRAAFAAAEQAAWSPSVYFGLETDGTLILVTHRSEMGTGIRSVLPLVLADELEADSTRVRYEQAIGHTKYGSQNTDGSCSIRDFYDIMRTAGASARLMLERAAAAQWGVPAGECKAQLHQVVHAASGRRAGYGELAALAKRQPVPKPGELRLKTPDQFRYIGKELPTIDRDDLCQGKGTFGMDAKVPGMVYASIERSPIYGAKLARFDDSAAKAVKGVETVAVVDPFKPPHVFQPLGGVAVIANSTWAAMQGRRKLKVEWENGPHAAFDSAAYKQSLFEAARKPQKAVRNQGDVDRAFAAAARTHEAEYYVPLLAHAPMEPPAAVAEFKDGKVTAWAATQNPQAVQEAVSASMGIPKEAVTCHVTLLGGGFGRKSKPDYVVEAAMLSKKVGKPVKVVWSREEDIRFDFYHAVAGMYFKAGTDAKGKPTAWLQRSVFPTIGSTFDASAEYGQEFEMGMGWVDLPFDIANHRSENGAAKNHVRIGWMRAVANIYHAFGIHSFADELAHAAGRDRVEFLLDLIGPDRRIPIEPIGMGYWNNTKSQQDYPVDTGRLKRVIQLVAEKSNWASKKPGGGRALGIAAHRSFLSYVAAVAEVEVDKAGKLSIPRIDIAVDAGTTINPDRVRAQFEGAAVFGASIALMGEITAAGGRIQQSNFHDYPVARMHEAPRETHVHVVPSTGLPAGVGEPGVPPIMPAIANAVFAATGKRIRELPLRKHKLV